VLNVLDDCFLYAGMRSVKTFFGRREYCFTLTLARETGCCARWRDSLVLGNRLASITSTRTGGNRSTFAVFDTHLTCVLTLSNLSPAGDPVPCLSPAVGYTLVGSLLNYTTSRGSNCLYSNVVARTLTLVVDGSFDLHQLASFLYYALIC
jgi:hypothetical protein